MPRRFVIKVTGAAGQGIKTSGLILAKSLKEAGLFSFGYTEYPSLIRGGHNVFQIEISDKPFASVSLQLDVLMALNEESVRLHQQELGKDGYLLFDQGAFNLNEEVKNALQTRNIQIIALNLLDMARQSGGSAIMKNIVSLGAIWKVFGLDLAVLTKVISEIFQKNTEAIPVNIKCAEAGFQAIETNSTDTNSLNKIFKNNPEFADYLIIGGNEAQGLGVIAAGVRLYSSYPMTPTSSLLTYLAKEGTKYGMIVKQAEDEITAANMVVGAYFNGTRAMCATSGGGFDLMTETLSLSGMLETPFVAIIGQRPGPATGLPTWTAQGDLNLAVYAGHGEFPRIVMAPGDIQEAFQLTAEAHNLAEKYQLPVLMLTDKFLGESMYTTPVFDQEHVSLNRGEIISEENADKSKTYLRYQQTESGVSPRWLPGSKISTFAANSDEHTGKGYTTEDAQEAAAMQEKRMLKETAVKQNLPDPTVYGDTGAEIGVISWGSNKTVILDAIADLESQGLKIAFMQITYIWPLKEIVISDFIKSKNIIATIECNYRGQLRTLIKQSTGLDIKDKLQKYNGRPFYIEEVVNYLKSLQVKTI